jgi:hypothetical protein
MIHRAKYLRPLGCLAVSLVAAPYSSVAQSPVAQSSPAPQDSVVIYAVRRGWHVDIGFAAADLQPPLKSLINEFPGVQYLFFGFGDRRYLLAKHRNAPVLLSALWPGPGMILATGLTSPPSIAFGDRHIVALTVTVRQASAAQTFMWHSLGKQSSDNESDPVKSYAPGPYEGSLFFTATPKYSAFYTCNTWAAESLAAAALPIHSAGVVFAGQLWAQVRRVEKKQSVTARQMAIPPNASHNRFSRPGDAKTRRRRARIAIYSTERPAVLDLRLLDRRVKFHHDSKLHWSSTIQGPRRGLESRRALRRNDARTNA